MMSLKSLNPLHFNSRVLLQPFKRANSTSGDLFKNIESIQNALVTIAKPDPFKGCMFDFTALKENHIFEETEVFKNIFRIQIEIARENGTHVLGMKIPAAWGTVMKAAIDLGFRHHHANDEYSLLNLCLSGHGPKECSFPAFRTVSAGVTAIVFDPTLEKVLVVTEKIGIKKPKPVTGGIEYGEKGDTPLKTVIRELEEEVQIHVKPEDMVLVGTGWVNEYRQKNPDIQYIFATRLKEMQEPVVQQSEIAKAEWVSIHEFMTAPDDEKEKPWLLRQVVEVAYNTLKKQNGDWGHKTLFLTNGKPVEFYSWSNRE